MQDLTAATTRKQWLTSLAQAYLAAAPNGGNAAILRQMGKVQDMPDADWPAYRAQRLAARNAPGRAQAISRMVGEIMGDVE